MTDKGTWVPLGNGRHRLVYPDKEQAENPEIDRVRRKDLLPEVRVVPDAEFVSTSLPRGYEIHKEMGGRFVDAPGTPEHGSVIIESRRQLRNLVRAAQDQGEALIYDGPGGTMHDPNL